MAAHPPLHITTCQAENTLQVTAGLARYLEQALERPVRCLDDISWQERYHRLDAGEIEIAWICGWPYVTRMAAGRPDIELLAAPVMAAPRYQQRPVYFSDLVVRRETPYRTFLDLRGRRFAINEPDSMSGCHIVRFQMSQLGVAKEFFQRVIRSGAHHRSLQLILDGEIDGSAIDSTLLEWEWARNPALKAELRVIDTFGPTPIPPLVVQRSLPEALRRTLREALLAMHRDPAGREILGQGALSHFTAVTDVDYDPIRRMGKKAGDIQL